MVSERVTPISDIFLLIFFFIHFYPLLEIDQISNNTPTNPAAYIDSTGINQVIYPQNQLISIKLEESNFLIWRQQILTTIIGYGLEGNITGDIEMPD